MQEQAVTHLLRMNTSGLRQLKGREVENLPGKDTYIFKIDRICYFLNYLGFQYQQLLFK